MWRMALLAAFLFSISQVQAGEAPATQPARAVVTVRTLDSHEPLAGAKISWDIDPNIKGSAVTNAAGEAAIEGIPSNCKYGYIRLSLQGWVPLAMYWNGASARDKSGYPIVPPLNFLLEKSHDIGGTVVDESGKPIAGANVFVNIRKQYAGTSQLVDGSWKTAATDARGHWSYSGVPADPDKIEVGAYDLLHLTDDCFQTTEFKPLASLIDGSAQLKLPSAAPIEVTVTKPDGSPAAGAGVFLGQSNNVSNCVAPVKTDARGQVVFGCKPGMASLLTATLSGFGPAQANLLGRREPQRISLVLTEAHPRTIDLVDSQGNGIAGATISVSKWSGISVLAVDVKTDEAGHGVWPSGPANDVGADIFADGFMRANILWSADKPARIVLMRLTPIIGRVVDAQFGEPITGFTIRAGTVWDEGQRLVWQNFDWADTLQAAKQAGEFSLILSQPAFRYQLRVAADNYLPNDSELFALDGIPRNLEFRLQRGESLTGTVVTGQNQPVAGAEVYAVANTDSLRLENGVVEEYYKNGATHATSDSNGRFVLPPQNQDYELLALSDRGTATLTRTELAGKPAVLRLTPWATLQGTISINGKPAAGLEVTGAPPPIVLADGAQPLWPSYFFTTDQNGKFNLPRVGAAHVNFTRTVGNHAPGRSWFITVGAIDAKAGESYNVNFGRGTTVTGQLLIPSAKPWMIRQARLEPAGRPHQENWENVEVAVDGSFHADGLAPGEYALHVALHEFPPGNDCGWGRLVGEYDKNITIPPGGRTLDIGKIAAAPIVGPELQVRWKRESNRGPARGIVKRMARAEKGATATGRWLG